MFLATFLITAILVHVFLFNYLHEIKHKSKLAYLYIFLNVLGVILNISSLCIKLSVETIHVITFQYIADIALELISPTLLLICLSYGSNHIKLKNKLWIYILPILSLLAIWTNQYHNLYYKEFSTNISNIKYNILGYISLTYALICQVIGLIIIFIKSFKYKLIKKKYLVLTISFSFPIILLIAQLLKINLNISVYAYPIIYTINIVLLTILTLKPKLLDVTSFTVDYTLDNMSQAYMILDIDGEILRTNKTFDNLIGKYFGLHENVNLYSALAYENSHLIKKFSELQHKITEEKDLNELKTHFYFKTKTKKMEYELEVHKLKYSDNKHIANIFLFKDMTAHREHFETIRQQKMLMYTQDQLATIGELATSFATDIESSLAIIKDGLNSLKANPSFNTEEQNLLTQMDICSNKISDISKNVSSNFATSNSTEKTKFNVCEEILDIQSIVASELKKYNCILQIDTSKKPIYIYGNKVKFNQVITNIVVNAIQAYDKNIGGVVIVNVHKKDNNAIIEIKDAAGGIDKKIAPYIFKDILTTKGNLGTGLGLHFSYTLVKGEFNGDISFFSKDGKTTFTVTIPCKKN